MYFTVEESNLMYIHSMNGADTRQKMLDEMVTLQGNLQVSDEQDMMLKKLSSAVLAKLNAMTDEDYDDIKGEIVGDFE